MKKSIVVGVASLLAVGAVQAATISWEPSVNMYQGSTVETFVNVEGTTAVAYNNTTDLVSGNTATTVNGVTFTPQSAGVALVGGTGVSITINGGSDNENAFGDGQFSSNGSIFHLLRGATFEVSSITLGGLQNNQEYLVQIFTHDGRGSRDSRYIAGFGDGSGSAAPVGTSDLSNGVAEAGVGDTGDSIIGTFTGDTTPTLTFNVFGSSNTGASWASGNSQSQINAIQVRAIPEPATLGLLAAFGGGILFIRRRFMI